MGKTRLAFLCLLCATLVARADSYSELSAGIQLYNLQRWDGVIARMDKALAGGDLVPSLQSVAHLDRGTAHLSLEHYDLAAQDFSASLVLQPNDPVALSLRSMTYLAAKKMDEAVTDLDSLIVARPVMRSAYRLRAAVNLERNKLDRVKDDLRTLLSLRGPDEPRNRYVGIIEWELGRVEESDDNFSYAAEQGKGDIYSWIWLSVTRTHRGKDIPRRALPDYDKTAWPAPIAGYFLGETGQEAAFAAAQKGDAKTVKGQLCEANFYVGELLLQRHDIAGGRPLIEKAVTECPTDFVEWAPAKIALAELP